MLQIYYKTEDASTTNNAVSVRINNQDDTPGTAVVTKSDAASTSWAVITIDDSEIDEGGAPDWDAAGERAVIRIKLKSKSEKRKTSDSRQVGITLYCYCNYIKHVKKRHIKNKKITDSSTKEREESKKN